MIDKDLKTNISTLMWKTITFLATDEKRNTYTLQLAETKGTIPTRGKIP